MKTQRSARAMIAASTILATGCAATTTAPHAPAPTATTTRPVATTTSPAASTSHDPVGFLQSRLQPVTLGDVHGALVVTDPADQRCAIYDAALAVLVFLRTDHRDDAERILVALAAMQRDDGALPFSFAASEAGEVRGRDELYIRSGALAWVGYAALEYLDAENGGSARAAATLIANRTASYLLGRRVPLDAKDDARAGLIRGGEGRLRYDERGDQLVETLEHEDVAWTSVEHNVDAYFFFRALARVLGRSDARAVADGIGHALIAHGWNADGGQLARGLGAGGGDEVLALDCASWGAVLLAAAGAKARAATAYAVADGRYAVTDKTSHAHGHRPYANADIWEEPVLRRRYGKKIGLRWDDLDGVWPEGTAGVAFAALRTGHRERARELLAGLEPLRTADGSLPTFTLDVPYELDTSRSVAGTAWVELVRFELERDPKKPTLWVP